MSAGHHDYGPSVRSAAVSRIRAGLGSGGASSGPARLRLPATMIQRAQATLTVEAGRPMPGAVRASHLPGHYGVGARQPASECPLPGP
jgi:hypothetical protein